MNYQYSAKIKELKLWFKTKKEKGIICPLCEGSHGENTECQRMEAAHEIN